jgi:hypothetical protein
MSNFKISFLQIRISHFEKCPNRLESSVVKKFMNLVTEFVISAEFSHRQRLQALAVIGQQPVAKLRPFTSPTVAAFYIARSTLTTDAAWHD